MLYLTLAIVSSSLISIIMRISSGRISAQRSMLAVNYLVCSALAAGYAGFQVITPDIPGYGLTVGLGSIGGILFLAGFVLLQMNTQKYGMVLSSLFMKLGLLVPILMSVVFFREMPTILQIIGFVIAVLAIVLMNLKKDMQTNRIGIGLFVMLIMGGGADAMAKVYERFGTPVLSHQFLFFTFAVAFLLCIGLIFWKKERSGRSEMIYGLVIGVPNFFSSKFLLGAMRQLPAVVVYPTFSVATILVVTLVGVLGFKERLSKIQWTSLAIIIIALFLLNWGIS